MFWRRRGWRRRKKRGTRGGKQARLGVPRRRVCLYLPEELVERVRRMAEREGVSLTRKFIELIEAGMEVCN